MCVLARQPSDLWDRKASGWFRRPNTSASHQECPHRECIRTRRNTHSCHPAATQQRESGHYEVRYKASHDWPIAFATVLLSLNGSTVKSARVVMGAVAPIPWRSRPAEDALVGKTITETTAAAAAEAALKDARPL